MPYYSHLKYVAIELTNNCNLKCKVCWSQTPTLREPRVKGYMQKELFQKVIKELSVDPEMHSVALHFAGESTLHPDFQEYSYTAKDCHFGELSLATNGTLLTSEARKTLVDCYDKLAISLHNTPKLSGIIDNYVALTKEAGDKARGYRINIVKDEYSPSELYKLNYNLSKHNLTVKEIAALSEDMHCNIVRTQYYPMCPNKYYYMAVLWNGDTLPCCHLISSGTWSLGNVAEKSLHDVFYGYKYKRLRQGHEKNTPCQNCTVRR
jgi:sulfatase maturation enzyme AslB (radical SAM superfamily)